MKIHFINRRRTEGAIRGMDVAFIVVGVLVLILLLVFSASRLRERALRARCGGNLKQIGLRSNFTQKTTKACCPIVRGRIPKWPALPGLGT